ncbi:MAG: hydrogenase maturation protease [Chloroflexi bacterium]|nr:hydrogenase maturation protease [Chloroflexota bacterium]MCL5026428.1 hydrogenase maturation protease [Chloroflexota bacterium]
MRVKKAHATESSKEKARGWRTIVLGMGNPILTDDCVGLRVAQEVAAWLASPTGAPYAGTVTVEESSLAGLSLLDLLAGYDRAIIVDSIQTRGGKVGALYRLSADDFASTVRLASPHDVNFFTALELGRRVGIAMPADVVVLAIEVQDTSTFGEACTPPVEAAIPRAVEAVLAEIRR